MIFVGCGRFKQTPHVVTFPDYIDPKLVADFERQFDCRIVFERKDSDVSFFVPREGSCMALDCFMLPAKARHRELAEAFLNYLMDPKVAAQNATFWGMATPNRAALGLLSPEIRTNSLIYPSPRGHAATRTVQAPR